MAKSDGRGEIPTWIVGIALSVYMALFIAGGIQLYLLNGRVSGMDSDIRHIGAAVDAIRLKQVSTNPSDPQNTEEAKRVLTEAKTARIRVSREVLTTTAKKFIDVAQTTPSAWDAVPEFLNYASFLNEYEKLPKLGAFRQKTFYAFN